MKYLLVAIILSLPLVTLAQKTLDITGRVSLGSKNTQYDQVSEIKPDSIAAKDYAKSSLIPGWQQYLSVALFARSRLVDIALLSELRNNAWDRLDSWDRLDRLSLSLRFGKNEIVLGDYFETGSEFFIQSREVRGLKVHWTQDDLWGRGYFWETRLTAGQTERPSSVGQRLRGLYHQYETAGQYRRYFASGIVRFGRRNRFMAGLKYLQARDDENSVSATINEPLTNQNAGFEGELFLWQKRMRFFAEAYLSRKDTLSAQNITDNAYKAGLDLRYKRFRWQSSLYRLGYDYYSAGYPFILNDRQGLLTTASYQLPRVAVFSARAERYKNNLNAEDTRPVTTTLLAEAGITTDLPDWPQLALKYRLRNDNSTTIMDSIKTEKLSHTIDGRLSFNFSGNRVSLSAIYIDLDDRSVLQAGQPLGTSQFIGSVNFYVRPGQMMFVSGGSVYSLLKLTNNQRNDNLYLYLSGRWDIVPRRLKLEAGSSFIYNDAANGGYQDMLSDYNQLLSDISLEYFFNDFISLKLSGGSDRRRMGYTTAEALQVIADPDYGPTFFNSFESYSGFLYGVELNWIF